METLEQAPIPQIEVQPTAEAIEQMEQDQWNEFANGPSEPHSTREAHPRETTPDEAQVRALTAKTVVDLGIQDQAHTAN